MKFKKNDEVIVIAGKDKGTIGRIEKILVKENKVIIKDVNMVTKHNKPSQQNQEGNLTSVEAPIHVSNVAYLVKKASKSSAAVYSKLGRVTNKDGKKVRLVKKTKKEIQ
ncbi:50S ribosomal protein L24 [Mycoplasma synoviae GX11-T]|nr:50S ribosomal protein L24 [Mycoplasmopsis synoviae]MBD5788991.1 50S ribosomal protein L24 [Mycoplasmopsis synoviae GX11-T]